MQLLRGYEHQPIAVPAGAVVARPHILFGSTNDRHCLTLQETQHGRYLHPGYYVGADWLAPGELAVQVQPKLTTGLHRVNYLQMLLDCLQQPGAAEHVSRIYQVEVRAAFIALPQHDDLLTPLLVAQYLHLLQAVVRQGLKKGYHPVARELRGRIKGKLAVAETLRRGTLRQRPLVTSCSYTEFSTDIAENQLLKQALRFARRYLAGAGHFADSLEPLLRYCEPAFEAVSEPTTARPVTPPRNPLYRAYDEALRVAELLLRRFGYSLRAAEGQAARVRVPPHWIDMAGLFELYVLGQLRQQLGSQSVLYGEAQAKGHYGLPDFLVPGAEPWIVDAKYKPAYQNVNYLIDDIRQLSGYARDRQVLAKLGVAHAAQGCTVVRCLLVYPDRLAKQEVPDPQAVATLPAKAAWTAHPIREFVQFYKLAVRLPGDNHDREAG